MTDTDKLMVLVFAPISAAVSTDWAGHFSLPTELQPIPEAVGMLEPRDAGSEDDFNRLRAEAEAHGCTADIIVRQSSDTPGYLAANVAYRVLAPTMKVARDLPGFMSLYDHSGEMYSIPSLRRDHEHQVRSHGEVTEYRMPLGMASPKMDDYGTVLTMIQMGELAVAVWLPERPGHWFCLVEQSAVDESQAVALTREFMERFA